MNLLEDLNSALRGLAANKLRSALTVLGILIGVGAVIILVAVALMLLLTSFVEFTRLGTAIRAPAQARDAAGHRDARRDQDRRGRQLPTHADHSS